MRFSLAVLLGSLTLLAMARPQDDSYSDPSDATITAPPEATPSDVDQDDAPDDGSVHQHTEPIPIFTKSCDCNLATAVYPCYAYDALGRCNFEENFSYACWQRAAGGCPSPTRKCGAIYTPTPLTGKHPCDLSPISTKAPSLPSLTPVIPTLTPISPSVPYPVPGNSSVAWGTGTGAVLPTLPVVVPTMV